ncbi:MAG: phenylalanine--tRNA ligase subunit beta [Oscillospiraceae bacterium]|nr:phenylalanine--tRNA ligase subunit beta [Oscillospiraceae bacterium]
MDLSRRWLLDYVDVNDIDEKTFADDMTLSGSKVESWSTEGEELKNIVVGQILSLERHPDSDHMWICSVDAGDDAPIQIVTGAQNLKVGDYVPAALHNSVVHGGHKITKGKLRGVESCGMLCSLGELGLTVHDFPYAIEDGIFVLGDDCDRTPGIDIKEAIGLNDTVTEFEITPNRPDCLSVVGLAREAAVTFGRKLTVPTNEYKTAGGDVKELLHSVTIDAPDKCYRYAGAVVKNVRVKPSPKWIRERLRASGVRPINNIVDITNFVMLEYGQPMHAFDLRYLDGGRVIVRNAAEGESITTLDGIERRLSPEMLVIADENKPVAVAGVMGGEFSGIMDDTNTIVFESACFYGPSIRKTAKKLGMRTEASGRFEKGLDPDGCLMSLKRALQLVEELDAGDIVDGVVDVYPNPKQQTVIDFCPDWVNNFIGINVSADEQKKILTDLEFEVKDGKIYVPSFRSDVEHKADISEEIARFYGFDKIAVRELQGAADGGLDDFQKFEKLIVSRCIALGLSEIVTYSFISPKAYDKIALPSDSALRKCVVISNPLGEDTGVMRTSMIPSMMDTLSRNYNNRNLSAFLFENGKVYIPNGEDELPDENRTLSIGMYGDGIDFFTLKGKVEALFAAAGVVGYDVEPVTDNPTFHPGRTARFTVGNEEVALLGEIHPDVAENYSIGTKVYVASISVDKLFKYQHTKRVYKPSPRFPALTRDLAVVCDRITPVLLLEKLIAKAVGKTLEHISLFDVYQGEQIEKGKKSVAFSLRLRAADKTMTDAEADEAMNKAIKALDAVGAELRK